MAAKPNTPQENAALRQRAEARLRAKSTAAPEGDPRRLLHELQVHQVELEMQNEELRDARSHLEDVVARYTDLYDFAPVGFFSLDAQGRIQEVNLPGAALLQIERSKLLRRRFSGFVAGEHLPVLEVFLRDVFASSGKQLCELALQIGSGPSLWVDLQATRTLSPVDGLSRCRLAVSNITAQKRAAEAQLRVQALEAMNTELENEISRRRKVEKSLRESRKSQANLLTGSKRMEEELRMLSHQILHSQEEERKRISHELHDEIAQTLIAINVHLAHLTQGAASDPQHIAEKIEATQKLVERSVESVHRFAMRLRPSELDDFGFLPALRTYIKEYTERTGLPVQLSQSTGALQTRPIDDTPAVVLFRVAQAALNNVTQHAQATQVHIHIKQNARSVCMKINDNGRAFDVENTLNGTKAKRLGLIGMRERVEMLGGRFTIVSMPGQGTTLSATLPHIKKPPTSIP